MISIVVIGTGLMLIVGAYFLLLVLAYQTRDHEYKHRLMRKKERPSKEEHNSCINFLLHLGNEVVRLRTGEDNPSNFSHSGQVRDHEVITGNLVADYEDFQKSRQTSSVSLHDVDSKDNERRQRSSSLLDNELPSYSSRTIGSRSSGDRPKISRRLSLSEKRELINVDDQISLVNLTRAHQTEQRGEEGQFYKSLPPRSSPLRLDSLSHLPKLHPTVDESVQWFRSPQGRGMSAEQSGISTTPRPQIKVHRRQSQLSVIVNPDEIKEVKDPESSNRTIIKTPRTLECDESEAYKTWRTKKSSSIEHIASQLDEAHSDDGPADFLFDSLSKYYHDLTEENMNNDLPGVSYTVDVRESSREVRDEDEITIETVETVENPEAEGVNNPERKFHEA